MKVKSLLASRAGGHFATDPVARRAMGGLTKSERAAGRFLRDGEGHPEPASGDKAVQVIVDQIKGDLAKSTDKLKEMAENALSESKKGNELASSLKEQVDELLKSNAEQSERLVELEQRGIKAATPEEIQTLGKGFADSEQVKKFIEECKESSVRGRVSMKFAQKAIISSATTDAAGSAGAALQPARLPGIQEQPRRTLLIQDLITPGRTGSSSVEYIQEKGFTNAAAMVAEGAAKPQSDIQLEAKTEPCRVIAHTAKATRQIVDDVPQIESFIDGKMTYGLALKKEMQILTGDGTGQNLNGIIPQATAYAVPTGATAAATDIDQLRVAMLQVILAEYPASAIVLNPIDWSNIETLKDSQGRYIIGNPKDGTTPRLWGLPVVASQSMEVDKFLVGAFALGAQYFDRWDARVEMSTENEDDFVKNMVTFLAEERGALAVYRPEAFVYGDFGNVA